MNTALLAILLVVGAGCFALALMLSRLRAELRRPVPSDAASGLLVLQQQLDALRDQMRASLEGGSLQIDRRLAETNRVVGDVRRGLGEVDRQVRSVSDAARELRQLQELLRSPKVRGGIGEYLLGELLAQVLPAAHFTLQYEFSTGERVDAVLRVGQGLVPVDAKFPLENFRRLRETEDRAARDAGRAFRADVRRHIDAIAKRYIRPGEGTYDFAMMYVPAETVYQEMLAQDADGARDLFHYALQRQVVPVSPQSFYAYLQVIVLGLRGLSLEGRASEIMERLAGLQNRLDRFTESFDTAVRHLAHAQRQMEEAGRRLARLESAFEDLTLGTVSEPSPTTALPPMDLTPST